MPKLITATDMIRSFSDVIGRVRYTKETFDITKGNNVVARLSPVAKRSIEISNLNNLFKSIPKITNKDQEDFQEILAEIRVNNGGIDSWE